MNRITKSSQAGLCRATSLPSAQETTTAVLLQGQSRGSAGLDSLVQFCRFRNLEIIYHSFHIAGSTFSYEFSEIHILLFLKIIERISMKSQVSPQWKETRFDNVVLA